MNGFHQLVKTKTKRKQEVKMLVKRKRVNTPILHFVYKIRVEV